MGNKGSAKRTKNNDRLDGVYKQRDDYFQQQQQQQQQNNSNSDSSVRSFWIIESQQSINSISRPWTRVSRKRCQESTLLTLSYESSKATWPVSQLESHFLPDFPVKDPLKDNNYKPLRQINRGAFGKIYKIKDLEKDEIFALKVLSKSKVIEDNSVRQVKQEVQIHRACGHHPFIVNCFSNWQTRKSLYIVTEYVEGGELWNLLHHLGVLPFELVQLYVAQIAFAIDFLHNAGVIYRDLKPENILLDLEANLKLTDFGLSKWLSLSGKTSTVCGTPTYMAPEIIKKKSYGHAVDWWSLGVVACLMLTSKLPHLTLTLGDDPLPTDHPKDFVMLPEEVALEAPSKDLLLRLLEIEPRTRLRSVRTLGTIAFYKGYKFDDVRRKKMAPKALLVKHFGEEYDKVEENVYFEGFDENFINVA